MNHLNAAHRGLFRRTFYPVALFAALIAAAIATARMARTNILVNHQLFDLTREEFSLLAAICLQAILWLLVSVGFIAGIAMVFMLYHQSMARHKV